jgi:hypothetical protein
MSLADGTPVYAVIADAGEYSLPKTQSQLFKNQYIVHFFPNRRTESDLSFSLILGMIHVYRPRSSYELKYAEQVHLPVKSMLDEDQ